MGILLGDGEGFDVGCAVRVVGNEVGKHDGVFEGCNDGT